MIISDHRDKIFSALRIEYENDNKVSSIENMSMDRRNLAITLLMFLAFGEKHE